MDGPAARDELARAERALAAAFERARAVGYRAGSSEMRELQHAELDYQEARRRRDLPPDPSPAVEVAEGLVVLPGDDRELDLREPREPGAAAPAPRRTEHRPC